MRYGVQGSGTTQTVSISGGATYQDTISETSSGTVYAIEVAVINSASTGIYSYITIVRTSVAGAVYCIKVIPIFFHYKPTYMNKI